MILSVLIFILLLISSSIISFNVYWENLSVNTGETAKFICDLPERYSNKAVDFYGPQGHLLVTKTGENIGIDDRTRLTIEHTYAWTWSLILSDASDDDAGEYTCRVLSDDRTLTIIKRFNLTVLTPPKIVDITIESNNNEILIENEQVILKCLARGIPQPKIYWNIPDKRFFLNITNHQHNMIIYDNKLIITNFSRTMPMNYECIADNGIPPRDTRTKNIVPAIPPEIIIRTSLFHFSSRILLNCTIIARPLISAKWKRNHREISNIERVEINNYTVQLILLLQINPFNYVNIYGMYECEAENQFKVTNAYVMINDSILSNITIPKQEPISTLPAYAHIELLLNCTSCSTYKFYLISCMIILFLNYSTGFYNKR